MKIKKIVLVFENLNSAELFPDMFCNLTLRGVNQTYLVNGFQYKQGEFSVYNGCNRFEITINKKGLRVYLDIEKQNLLDRFSQCNDLTQIILDFGKYKKTIILPWEGENYVNEKQRAIKNEDGSITIKINN